MGGPRRGKVGGGAPVALGARGGDGGLHRFPALESRRGHVVVAVTFDAGDDHLLVRGRGGARQEGGDAVEIGEVRLGHGRGDAVLRHPTLICVTADADLWRAEAEPRRAGLLDLMVGVAVGARRNVLVAVLHEGLAVDAPGVLLIDGHVARGAAARHHGPLRVRVLDVVGAVAIGADRGGVDAALEELVVDALQRARVRVEVALLAGLIGSGNVRALARKRGVAGVLLIVPGVAVRTHELRAVHRLRELLRVHVQAHGRAVLERQRELLVLVAVQAVRDTFGQLLAGSAAGEEPDKESRRGREPPACRNASPLHLGSLASERRTAALRTASETIWRAPSRALQGPDPPRDGALGAPPGPDYAASRSGRSSFF